MKNGKLEIDPWGDKYWYLEGKLHRLDGPAVIWADGNKYWYLNDIRYTEAQFNNIILTNWIWFFS